MRCVRISCLRCVCVRAPCTLRAGMPHTPSRPRARQGMQFTTLARASAALHGVRQHTSVCVVRTIHTAMHACSAAIARARRSQQCAAQRTGRPWGMGQDTHASEATSDTHAVGSAPWRFTHCTPCRQNWQHERAARRTSQAWKMPLRTRAALGHKHLPPNSCATVHQTSTALLPSTPRARGTGRRSSSSRAKQAPTDCHGCLRIRNKDAACRTKDTACPCLPHCPHRVPWESHIPLPSLPQPDPALLNQRCPRQPPHARGTTRCAAAVPGTRHSPPLPASPLQPLAHLLTSLLPLNTPGPPWLPAVQRAQQQMQQQQQLLGCCQGA
jgi:hypothetical protein